MEHTIFFDMDGTILDTERYFRQFWQQAARECGYFMTDAQALSMRSLGRPFAAERVNGWFRDNSAYGKIRERRRELMREKLSSDGIPLKPFVEETLAGLKRKGHHLAIATATDLERTEAYLKETGLLEYFESIICATMVERGKPAPDVYLYACRQVGIQPEQAYAVEDSPNGVTSAYQAGCKVIMVPDQTQPDAALHRLLFRKIDTLKELLNIF